MKIAIYGIGNFGYALLRHLCQTDKFKTVYQLYAYDTDRQLIESLRHKRVHTLHHRNVKLPEGIIFAENPQQLLDKADILVLAVTSTAIKDVLTQIRPFINQKLIILNTAKSLDIETGQRYSLVIARMLAGVEYPFSTAMLAGGTIAYDLFKHEPLGIDIASENKRALKVLKEIFATDNLKVSVTTDLSGVEYAAAFKNVISIMAGIIKGLGLPYGSQTFIISKAADEVKNLVIDQLGGRVETFSIGSQCWGNDLWMSCTSNTRNREFGILLGKGNSVEAAIAQMKSSNKTIEGIHTIAALRNILKENPRYPILRKIIEIVYERQPARETFFKMLRNDNL
jgi:glycerol-3-phosphate dehydrogenase (NAD(P)+)